MMMTTARAVSDITGRKREFFYSFLWEMAKRCNTFYVLKRRDPFYLLCIVVAFTNIKTHIAFKNS